MLLREANRLGSAGVSLGDLFKRNKGPSPEEIAAAERELRLRDKLTKQLAQDPRFQVFTSDGLSWIDPFTGNIVETPFDQQETTLTYLMKKRPWTGGIKPQSVVELLAVRWSHYLKEVMPEDRRFRFFDQRGAWLDPFLGAWVPAVRMGDKVDLKSLTVMSEYLAEQDQDALSTPMSESKLEALASEHLKDPSSIADLDTPRLPRAVAEPTLVTHVDGLQEQSKPQPKVDADQHLHKGQILGGFRVQGLLGEGGMGQVYRALQMSLERTVALKVLPLKAAEDEDFRQRFLREARCAASVNHPNVVACYDVGHEHGYLYMALELVPGGDASDLAYAQPKGQLDEKTTLRLIRDCARGLTAIDEAGLVHRDIKPSNIFLGKHGEAKIGDLGLTRSQNKHITMTGKIIGTPAFMSPEQITNGEHLDIGSDMYALGASAYALLAGKAPFHHDSVYTLINMVVNDKPQPLADLRSDVSEATVKLIEQLMAKKRKHRFATADDVVSAVEEIL